MTTSAPQPIRYWSDRTVDVEFTNLPDRLDPVTDVSTIGQTHGGHGPIIEEEEEEEEEEEDGEAPASEGDPITRSTVLEPWKAPSVPTPVFDRPVLSPTAAPPAGPNPVTAGRAASVARPPARSTPGRWFAAFRAGLDRGEQRRSRASGGGVAVLVTLTVVALAAVLVAGPGPAPRATPAEPSPPVGETRPIQPSNDLTIAITPASTVRNLAAIGPQGTSVTTSTEQGEHPRNSMATIQPARSAKAGKGDSCSPPDAACTE